MTSILIIFLFFIPKIVSNFQEFCEKDFCVQLITGDVTQDGNVTHHVIKQWFGTPLQSQLKLIEECPLPTTKGQNVFLCGNLIDGEPVVNVCDQSSSLLASKKCFFSKRFLTKNKGFKAPPSSPSSVFSPIIEDNYRCLLIPFDSRSLSQFLANNQKVFGIIFCPKKFICLQEDEEEEEEDGEESGKRCPKHNFPIVTTPPWLIPLLENLVFPKNSSNLFSETNVEMTCQSRADVTLGDGTRLVSEKGIKSIETSDGTRVLIGINGTTIVAIDGTEFLLAANWSSKTRFKDKTRVEISDDKRVDIETTDDSRLEFSSKGLSLALSDNTSILCSEYGIVVNIEGKETFIPSDSRGIELLSQKSRIKVKEGLEADVTTSSGTHVLITMNQTIVFSRNGASIIVSPETSVTIRSPSAMTLMTSLTDNHMTVTTADGSQLSYRKDDSLLLLNEKHAIVVFPNENAIVVTEEEIISLSSDGSVIVTDIEGSLETIAQDSEGVPCVSLCASNESN